MSIACTSVRPTSERTRLWRLKMAFAMSVVLFGLVGCGATGGDAGGQTTAAGPRIITDAAGRQVEVPAHVQRVITVGSVPVLNSFPFAVGMGDRIVNGMPPNNVDGYQSYETLAPQLLTNPAVQTAIGNDVNSEKVLELTPDVVLTSNTDVAQKLQSLGVPSVVLSLETGENIKKSVQITGDVFGVPDRADAYVAYFDEVVNRVERIAATIPEADKPSVLYIDTRPLRRPNLIMEWMLNRVGVESVTKDVAIGQYQFTAEQLLAWDPELLIGMRPYDRDDLLGDSRFASLQAVKNNALKIVPTGIQIWGNNTAEQPLAVAWVATQVFPGHYAEINMTAETKRFYSEFFRIDLTDQQVADLLAARL